MTINKRVFFKYLIIFALLSGCSSNMLEEKEILVFAPASLRDVMHELAVHYKQKTGTHVFFNFAGSNVLAKQIEAATQADIYLSADIEWMQYLSNKNLIHNNSKQIFLSNKLVIVAEKGSPWVLKNPLQLSSLPFKFLSLADPDAVPAGRYAKQYLNSLTLTRPTNAKTVWASIEDRVLPAPDVRAAASIVENRSDAIGIVYKTDAIASNKLRILYEINSANNTQLERIQYVAARVKKTSDNTDVSAQALLALGFLDYLMQEEAQSIFRSHGFDTTVGENV